MTLLLALLLASFTVNVVIAIIVVVVPLRSRRPTKRIAISTPGTEDIYTLIDPDDGRVRYVGRSNDVRRRTDQHIRLAFTYGALITWIHELYMRGLQPRVKIVKSGLATQDARIAESQLIEDCVRAGEKLLNRQLASPGFEMSRRIIIEKPEP